MPNQKNFQAFTKRFNGIASLLFTDVHVTGIIDNDLITSISSANAIKYNAIWDTGATNSVITQKVVDDLALMPIGMKRVKSVSTEEVVNTYNVSIFLPNNMCVYGLEVTLGKMTDFDILIGMDIIRTGDLAVSHKEGKTVLSFIIPSIKEIDFVKEVQALNNSLIGRNNPCPCGSKKKYKKCCGKS
ncbi:MAG: SEC-C metal-binding domain-containing protein [Nitrospirota bacterium]